MIETSEDESERGSHCGRTITWDEKTISEQNKERGTRTKISEASTPFCYMSDTESQDESTNYYANIDNPDLTQDVISRLCEIKESYDKKRKFAEHRKHHYRHEFVRRQSESSDDGDVDDEGKRDEGINGKERHD
ncbi:hypothetical protein BgAZ_303860 [Babesia gibsoni]|uniref:Protein phosphatase inhibitor 2 n=1 Tax=Babesia gibsoni TaxID=33632 RepID=A0AAD8LNT9_BABGI|nr:hypothetical protein BgAZ_303860 [Babesia gibsoni]